jgi:hypothetical protein
MGIILTVFERVFVDFILRTTFSIVVIDIFNHGGRSALLILLYKNSFFTPTLLLAIVQS